MGENSHSKNYALTDLKKLNCGPLCALHVVIFSYAFPSCLCPQWLYWLQSCTFCVFLCVSLTVLRAHCFQVFVARLLFFLCGCNPVFLVWTGVDFVWMVSFCVCVRGHLVQGFNCAFILSAGCRTRPFSYCAVSLSCEENGTILFHWIQQLTV